MRDYRRLHVRLPKRHRDNLDSLLSGGIQPVRVVLRALALSQLREGKVASEVAARCGSAIGPESAQRIIAMVCAVPPQGYAHWSVRLVVEEVVKRKLVPTAGRETIQILPQDHDLQPWREKMWCIAELDDEYIERMVDVLEVYERPLSTNEPIVCVDEKPVTLHKDCPEPHSDERI